MTEPITPLYHIVFSEDPARNFWERLGWKLFDTNHASRVKKACVGFYLKGESISLEFLKGSGLKPSEEYYKEYIKQIESCGKFLYSKDNVVTFIPIECKLSEGNIITAGSYLLRRTKDGNTHVLTFIDRLLEDVQDYTSPSKSYLQKIADYIVTNYNSTIDLKQGPRALYGENQKIVEYTIKSCDDQSDIIGSDNYSDSV